MLLKPLSCYFAGVATVALAFSAASANPGRLGLGLGILTTIVGAAWALGSRERARWAGKFLLHMAEPEVQTLKVAKDSRPQTLRPEPTKLDGKVFGQVVMGLRGLGMDIEAARRAAGEATCRLPDGKLDETLNLAIRIATARDAA